MFKFVPIESFKTTVKLMLPTGEEQQFTATFAYLDDKAAEEVARLPAADLLRKVWTGWEDIVGPDDKPLPFAAEQRELFLGHAFIVNGVVLEYFRARQGLRAKN